MQLTPTSLLYGYFGIAHVGFEPVDGPNNLTVTGSFPC